MKTKATIKPETALPSEPQVRSSAWLACARYHRKQVRIYDDVQLSKGLGKDWKRYAARRRPKHERWAQMLEALANEAQANDKLTHGANNQ